ncbi:MAG: glycosyltransferase family 4 protein [Candidatus Marinimicrobia bacterium]|nr:glycosyltransferase family 4 protein [Candidatus Neomarinimicrobiota bacterium]
MKKICLISSRNIYMKRICNFLSENSYEVHLICRHKNGLNEEEFNKNIKFHQLSSNRLLVKFKEIRKIIKTIKPDIVHTHYLTKDAFIPVMKINRKYKYVITIWGSDINIFAKTFFNKIFQNIGLIFCDEIQLLSSFFLNKLKETFVGIKKNKIRIFSWGIDYDFFHNPQIEKIELLKTKLNINEDNLIILSCRNHKRIYNHHTTIKSIPKVVEKYPEIKFVFTRGSCDKEYLAQSYELVKKLGIENNFIFIDKWLSNEEICALINLAHINISIPFKDGLPATLLEIMATKSIPIVSDLESYYPFFKEKKNGFYLSELENHNELAKVIINALKKNNELSKQFSQINNKYIEKYQNWEMQSEKLLEFYSN